MYIYNLKINSKKIAQFMLALIGIIIVGVIGFSVFSIYKAGHETENSIDSNIIEITTNEYTSFLKNAHENIDDYVGMKIKITGYVYRMADFDDTQFVISRTMIMDSSSTAVVVGILSKYDNAKDYKDGDWVEVTGTIIRGNYKGEMPVVQVNDIKTCDIPEDEYVYPPSESSSI